MTDYAKLRALAEAATPGSRYLSENDGAICADDGPNGYSHIGDVDFNSRDLEFTLAVSPNVVIAMLDEIERLQGVVDSDAEHERVPPLTIEQIESAFARGRAERKCAEGDHAWVSLQERNRVLCEQLAAAQAECERLRPVYEIARRWCSRPESVLSEGAGVLANDAEMWRKLRAAVALTHQPKRGTP